MLRFDYDDVASSVLGELEPSVEASVRHNLAILRAIHWGAREVCRSPIEFDPRADWWRLPERRFAVAFLSYTWKDWPADAAVHSAIESFCVASSSALDGLRESKALTFEGYDYERGGGEAQILKPVRGVVSRIGEDLWTSCRPRKYSDYDLSEAFDEFLGWIEEGGFSYAESTLQDAMRWWAVLGAHDVASLRERQRFFWLYRLLLCTTNAYVNAGAQYFGPVIGNTEVGAFRRTIARWREGADLHSAPLMGYDRDSEQVSDFSDNNIARELWGFLNLHRGPFYNTRALEYLESGESPMQATRRIGDEVRSWLMDHPQRRAQLAKSFARWLPIARKAGQQPLAKARRYRRKFDDDGNETRSGAPFDLQLNDELEQLGTKHLLETFGEHECAAIMMHLALDAEVYYASIQDVPKSHADGEVDSSPDPDHDRPPRMPSGTSEPATRLRAAKGVWIYAPGGQASSFPEDVEQRVARIYWDELGDLKDYETKDELKARLVEQRGEGAASPINDSNTVWSFGHEVEVGDVVIARRGRWTVVGAGQVKRPYYYTKGDIGQDIHCLGIDWFWVGEFELPTGKAFHRRTFIRGDQRKVLLDKLARHLVGHESPHDDGDDPTETEAETDEVTPYTMDEATEDLFFDRTDIEKWSRLLERRRNLVLTGPPGVGKTFVAKRLAQLVTGVTGDAAITIVQFHQAYTYEQFVLGYRPAGGNSVPSGSNAKPQFEMAKGPLFRLAEQALLDPNANFVLIIDEINRGNISRILGEALMLLEADKRSDQWGLELAYAPGDSEFKEERFYLPPNLFVIGTMNTADRSLAVVDYALRRRFAFVDVEPRLHSAQYEDHARRNRMPEAVLARLRERIAELNHRISEDRALGPGFMVGHSFFTAAGGEDPAPWEGGPQEPDDSEARAHAWLDDVFEYEIDPLLREYWAESRELLEAATQALWKGSKRR